MAKNVDLWDGVISRLLHAAGMCCQVVHGKVCGRRLGEKVEQCTLASLLVYVTLW